MSKRLYQTIVLYEAADGATKAMIGVFSALCNAEAVALGLREVALAHDQFNVQLTYARQIGDAMILEAADLIRAEREGGA